MLSRYIICILIVCLAVAYGQVLFAGARSVPKMLNYQGYLTDTLGSPVDDSLDMTFRIFDAATMGNELWSESQLDVPIERGVFSVLLGSGTPIPDTVFTAGTDRWLELTLEGPQTLSPRTRITAMGYAYTSTYSDTAEYARNAATDNDWVITGNVLHPAANYGLSQRQSNVMHGQHDSTHVNFGTACTTGTSGQHFIYCTVGGGGFNTASADYATVTGGWWNTASGYMATVGGGGFNTASDSCATVAGGVVNTASGSRATVGGGYHNTADTTYATVGGGRDNTASLYATVGGGYQNTASGYMATVGGGENNAASARATVGGGGNNTASDYWATVGGGSHNSASNEYATVGGGSYNTASLYATVGGGGNNTASGSRATVGGGENNTASNDYATVGGGYSNTASSLYATVGGGIGDTVNARYGGVAAGYSNLAGGATTDTAAFVGGGYDNSATAKYATVGGGYSNTADTTYATVGGGSNNTANGHYATVGGGRDNFASLYATVGGGYDNTAWGSRATVGGGQNNTAAVSATVGGGYQNTASDGSTVGGGSNNTANGSNATVGGGWNNTASGYIATVGGGRENLVEGVYSAILGGYADTITATADHSYLFGINSNLTQDSTFMVDMPHIRFGDEVDGYEFPTSDGARGQIMTTDGSGQLSWTTNPLVDQQQVNINSTLWIPAKSFSVNGADLINYTLDIFVIRNSPGNVEVRVTNGTTEVAIGTFLIASGFTQHTWITLDIMRPDFVNSASVRVRRTTYHTDATIEVRDCAHVDLGYSYANITAIRVYGNSTGSYTISTATVRKY